MVKITFKTVQNKVCHSHRHVDAPLLPLTDVLYRMVVAVHSRRRDFGDCMLSIILRIASGSVLMTGILGWGLEEEDPGDTDFPRGEPEAHLLW